MPLPEDNVHPTYVPAPLTMPARVAVRAGRQQNGQAEAQRRCQANPSRATIATGFTVAVAVAQWQCGRVGEW
jgi:hypothetical protein